ncbi:hypothetical protein F4814DRAFT_448010 [Daldinia grandis]|nr:hypothetical protein F4814DRAFT_448010 [Daldinia grandis]
MATHLPLLSYLLGVVDTDQRWGFFVYRTIYDDQVLWERYLTYIQGAIAYAIQPSDDRIFWNPPIYRISRRATLRSRFELWTIEDEGTLKEKPILDLREEFRHWVAPVSPEEKKGVTRPRYNYFLYVDKDVLDRFKGVEAARGDREPDYIQEEVVIIVVDAHSEEDTFSDSDEYCYYNGKDKQVYSIPRLYDSVVNSDRGWLRHFARPPRVYGIVMEYLAQAEGDYILLPSNDPIWVRPDEARIDVAECPE